jgi:glycosyltransferase involved in cell wall biosynthesis
MPLINVYLTVRDREENYLRRAIESVLRQYNNFSDFKLHIFADGSSPETLSICEEYERTSRRFVSLHSSSAIGRGKALKTAIEVIAPDSEYICWVDSDDILNDSALLLSSSFLNHYSLPICFSDYRHIDSLGKSIAVPSRHKLFQDWDNPLSWIINFVPFHFRLFSRELYDSVGGINVEYSTIEDYDLCLRMFDHLPVSQEYFLPLYLYQYRLHSNSLCSTEKLSQYVLTEKAIRETLLRRNLDLELKSYYSPKYQLVVSP